MSLPFLFPLQTGAFLIGWSVLLWFLAVAQVMPWQTEYRRLQRLYKYLGVLDRKQTVPSTPHSETTDDDTDAQVPLLVDTHTDL
eukprot:scaffold208627_cov55-Prasinocladus_malaysianus.AAC.2